MARTDVPFLDLVTPHVEMEEQLVSVFRTALRTAGFIGGKPVQDFEEVLQNSVTWSIASAWVAEPMHCALHSWRQGSRPETALLP